MSKITKFLIFLTIMIITVMTVNAATLTCEQTTSTSLSIPQFSSKNIEIKCTASGGTVSNVQITPNSNPSTGLTISNTETIGSSISDSSSSTGKWSVTGDTPNTYSVSYTVSSSATNSWSGASTTQIVVPSAAQLTVEYVLPPSIFTPSVNELDFKINNIGGTTANNVNMKLYNGETLVYSANYPTTILASATASYSWTNETGFNESGTYTTKVYIGEVYHNSAIVSVNTGNSNQSQEEGWNLISLSKVPSNLSVASVLGDVSDDIEIVWSYDTSEVNEWERWKRYTPGGTMQFTEFSILNGYWLNAEATIDLEITGTDHTSTDIELLEGWNLVGFPSSLNLTVADSITSISDDIDIIWFYDTNEANEWERWKRYTPGGTMQFTEFEIGNGYWFNTNTNVNWTVG